MNSLLETVSMIKNQQIFTTSRKDLPIMRQYIADNFPYVTKALQSIDRSNTQPKRRKGLNLVKVGKNYYARFTYNGIKIPTKFNTKTSNIEEAEKIARENKSAFIEKYLARKDGRMYKELEEIYNVRTEFSDISDRIRKEYRNVIINKFIPFLRDKKILCFEQTRTETLEDFQDYLHKKGVKPQTVNSKQQF
jgi:hypothetical protein